MSSAECVAPAMRFCSSSSIRTESDAAAFFGILPSQIVRRLPLPSTNRIRRLPFLSFEMLAMVQAPFRPVRRESM